MRQYNLEVSFQAVDDEEYSKIVLTLRNRSFKYWINQTVGKPDRMYIELQGLSAEGVEQSKAHFRKFNLKGGSFTTVEIYG